MTTKPLKIGVVATGSRFEAKLAEATKALANSLYPDRPDLLAFHPNSFSVSGHFAGEDSARAQAFLDIANDPAFSAVWIARGGYGAGRILDLVLPKLTEVARQKTYLGYSDAGMILGALYRAGFRRIAHGPMPTDLGREGGQVAVERALRYLVEQKASTLEPRVGQGTPLAAFNLTIFCHLLGTPHLPDLTGHILMLEEVSEPLYRIDRSFLQITSVPALRGLAGIALGRVNDIVPNGPAFGQTEEEIARHWCTRSGIPYLGRADIGHDSGNKIVPFGTAAVA